MLGKFHLPPPLNLSRVERVGVGMVLNPNPNLKGPELLGSLNILMGP